MLGQSPSQETWRSTYLQNARIVAQLQGKFCLLFIEFWGEAVSKVIGIRRRYSGWQRNGSLNCFSDLFGFFALLQHKKRSLFFNPDESRRHVQRPQPFAGFLMASSCNLKIQIYHQCNLSRCLLLLNIIIVKNISMLLHQLLHHFLHEQLLHHGHHWVLLLIALCLGNHNRQDIGESKVLQARVTNSLRNNKKVIIERR